MAVWGWGMRLTMGPTFITTAEAARILGRDPKVVRRLIDRGLLTARRDERFRWHVALEEVMAISRSDRPRQMKRHRTAPADTFRRPV